MSQLNILIEEAELVAEKVPENCRGVLFHRVLKDFHPQENTRRLECAFAETWAEMNNGEDLSLLCSLLMTDEDDPRRSSLPISGREWEVASVVAATIIQWLPTSVGCGFLRKAFRRGGGSLDYTLPET